MGMTKWVTSNPGEVTDTSVRVLIKTGVALTVNIEYEGGMPEDNPRVTLALYDDEITMRLRDWAEVMAQFMKFMDDSLIHGNSCEAE